MDHWLDDLARAMAGGVSRRRALGRVAALFGGAALATVLPAAASADSDDNRAGPCDEFCERLPRDLRDRCRDEAKHGHGLCYDCGPLGDNKGICGKVCCPTGQDCLNGTCVGCATGQSLVCSPHCSQGQALQCVAVCGASGAPCPPGTTCCGASCTDTTGDANNCGACGTKCGPGQTCSAGRCTGGAAGCTSSAQCPAGQVCCAGACVPLNTATNCGACGISCATGQHCVNGACVCDATSCPNGCCDPQTGACLTSCSSCNSGHICRSDHQCGCGVAGDCPTGLACGTAGTCSTICFPNIGSVCNAGCCSGNPGTCQTGSAGANGVCQ
jgi:hypothetical protein